MYIYACVYRSFFPYYVYNIVGGVDAEGKGCVFSYDPVGSYERTPYIAAGTGQQLLQPLLDNQLGHKNIVRRSFPLSITGPFPHSLSLSNLLMFFSSLFWFSLIPFFAQFFAPLLSALTSAVPFVDLPSILISARTGGTGQSPDMPRVALSKEKVVALVKDIFVGATEREIYTGDNVDIFVITKVCVARGEKRDREGETNR